MYSILFTLLPFLSSPSHAAAITTRDSTSRTLRATWQQPSDTLSVLLIIGGDVIQKALAQLAGRRLVPVAFSFGWVAYSFTALMAVVGDGRLMPPPDCPARVINAANGFARDNRSWILGRLVRDFEHPLPDHVGLSITVFEAASDAGLPTIDWCWISGVVIIAVQLAIAAIPYALYDDWGILLVTAAGIALALATGLLPQWKFEKWAARRASKKVVSLTGGNGTRHVMVIIGKGMGLDLEDLAAAESPRMRRRGDDLTTLMIRDLPAAFWLTRAVCVAHAVLWIVFLITVTSLKSNTWYLLAVGGVGMVQNAVTAGARRDCSTSGIHLLKIENFQQRKAMHALMDLEDAYPTVGKSLVPEFFPGLDSLRPPESKWWYGKECGDRDEFENARWEKDPSILYGPLTEQVATARGDHRLSLDR